MATRLGVDLGTTWTAAAISDGRAEVLQLGTHTLAMPSVVAIEGDGFVVGEAAERRLAADPASGAREVKRRLGDTTPIVVGGKPYGPEALMAPLLAEAIAKATTQMGSAPASLTLTHPANWGEYKLDLLREIARLAGRDHVDLLPEPAAAALHYAQLGKLNAGDAVAVYDFGGGTFDVAVVRCEQDSATILGTPNGLERLGGVDLDQIILVHVDSALDGKLREVDSTNPDVRAAIAQLRASCTAAKEALSSDSDAVVQVALPDLRTEVRMTRAEFETAVRARVEDTLGAFDRAVTSSGVAVGDLAGVLLVGGSSRIPVVAELVAAHTGRPILVDADAKAVVALGASAPAAEQASAAAAAVAAEGKKASRERVAARGRGERGSAATRVVGAVAGTVAAAGVTAAGVMGYRALTDDDGGDGSTDDTLAGTDDAAVDESMDAFDDLSALASAAGAADAGGPSGGGGGGGGQHFAASGALHGGGGAGYSDSPAGRLTARMFAPAPDAPMAPPPMAAPAAAAPGSLFSDPGVDAVRAELRSRLDSLQVPDGADPAAVADMKADLQALLDHYHSYPGQSLDDAVATLRYQFEDRVHDFAQDQKLDALLDERTAEEAAQDAIDTQVDTLRDQLQDRLDNWQAPAGASPEAVAEMKADLEGMLNRFTPIPGQSADDALADLRERFNTRVTDFAQDQKLDAVLEELGVSTTPPAPGTTTTAADGTTTMTGTDGTTTVTAPDGTVTTTAPDGTVTTTNPDGTTSTTPPAPGTTTTTTPAPGTTTTAADGTTTMTGTDGTTTVTAPDGTVTTTASDGTVTTTNPDGTTSTTAPTGDSTTTTPADGTTTTTPADGTPTTTPTDGTTTTTPTDGTTTTTPADGDAPLPDLTFDPNMARSQGYTDDQVQALQDAHDAGVTVDVGQPGAPTPEGGFEIPTGIIPGPGSAATMADAGDAVPQNTGIVPPNIVDTFDDEIALDTAATATTSALGDPPPPGVDESLAPSEAVTSAAAATPAAAAPMMDDALGTDTIMAAATAGTPAPAATPAAAPDTATPDPAVTMTADDLGIDTDGQPMDELEPVPVGVPGDDDLAPPGMPDDDTDSDSDYLTMADQGSLPDDTSSDMDM